MQFAELIRCLIGGVLMGLANLVPGISGGTMLVAAGIYTSFVEAVAELTSLRFGSRVLATLGTIGGSAALTILLLAGQVRDLVVFHRWIMYSIFIGLTLGGLPVIYKLIPRLNVPATLGCGLGLLLMVLLAWAEPHASDQAATASYSYLVLFFAGLAGASAMVLPGISGGYLLLLMGQYVPILSAISSFKSGLQTLDLAAAWQSALPLVPVGIGVALGIAAVSNLIKLLLHRYPAPTLGFLLGLVAGAVIGLWPFQRTILPPSGLSQDLRLRDLPVETFTPTPLQVLVAAGLIVLGFLATVAISKLGYNARSHHRT